MSEATAPAPATPSLTITALLAGAVMLIDGYDLQVMAVLLPVLAKQWGMAPADFGLVMSAPVLGLGLGAAFVAPLGDRYGRRPFVLGAFALLGLSVFASAFAGDVTQLGIWRLLTGIGLGATLPNVSALVAELAPAKNRAGLLTLIGAGIAIGALSSGLLVPPIIESFGWQGAFWLSAAVTAVIWLLLLWRLPESPAHLARSPAQAKPESSFKTIVAPRYLRGTILLWLLFAGNGFLLYMLTSWVPSLLTARGWGIAEAGGMIAWMQAGGLAGGLAIAALMDRWRPNHALLVAYVVSGTGLALFSLLPDNALLWGVLIALVGAGISGVALTINAVAAALYPATILSAGIGFTVAVARIGAIGGPIVGAWLLRQGIAVELFLGLMLIPVVICAASALSLPIRHQARDAAPETR